MTSVLAHASATPHFSISQISTNEQIKTVPYVDSTGNRDNDLLTSQPSIEITRQGTLGIEMTEDTALRVSSIPDGANSIINNGNLDVNMLGSNSFYGALQNGGSASFVVNGKYNQIFGDNYSWSNQGSLSFDVRQNSELLFYGVNIEKASLSLNGGSYVALLDGGNSSGVDRQFLGMKLTFDEIASNGDNNLIDLAYAFSGAYDKLHSKFVFALRDDVEETAFNQLVIGKKDDTSGLSGINSNTTNFLVFVNPNAKQDLVSFGGSKPQNGEKIYSDRVVIHSSKNNQGGNHNLGIVFSFQYFVLNYLRGKTNIQYSGGDITKEGNIAVASVAKSSKIELTSLGSILGFNLIETSFEKVFTNDQGIIDSDPNNNTYTTYFLKSAKDSGVAPITQEVTSSVFALNYDLFIANFNSLNKRMGDLRNNPYSQGAWGRIFNGQLSNDFGLGSQNNYTTLQAGYDYDFALTNAKNYLGVAFAYGFSISEMSSNASNALQSREIKDIFSNNIELALYNAYVEDSGLYSDSIAKFSYLMSNFNLTNNGVSESLNVNNYAFQLSEEVGYVFTLGESKEWSITPQAELSFGYYSDSDLTQVAGDFYLDAKAKSMLMLRARVGAMVGYDFKQYTQDKDITTTLYAGLSYEYDYLSGGDIELTPNIGKATTTKSALSSDGRGVLNLGTNITLKDDIRLYADFQTSFGGKINTDYQINIGARFSFGERGEEQKDREEVPLKIEG